ncbi:MAG: hypothetical protein Q9214_000500 [Letrouitia sp. 1 TL-2023]
MVLVALAPGCHPLSSLQPFRRRVSADENLGRLERAISGLTASRRHSPVRQASSEDDSLDDSSKGTLGLNLLRDVTEPVIEFIFVHGLGGGSRKTWSKSSNQYHYWPKEWLSQDPEFGCVRVWSFGYKADWNERKDTVLEIHDFALALLGEIRNAPNIRRSKTKIVFIAHSMGGLVIKQKKAYILAQEDPALKELASRIHTLYFLATPHRGSDLTKILMNVLKVSYGQKAFVAELERNSGFINSTNDSFRHYAENLQLWSFYETFPSQIVLTNAVIVDKSSATLGYAREHISPLNADHRSVCKFDLPSDPNYKTLRNAFITTIDIILSEISQVASETTKLQHDKLVELTGISEAPINDLLTLDDVRVTGSCEWLTSKPTYSSWRTPWSDRPPIFWLLGNAGAGKSVLCSQVIRDLQMENLRCSHFFFRHGNDVNSSIAGCLRALAYQMATSDGAVLRKVLEMEQESVPCVQWDERTIWQKLFLGCIFKLSKPLPQFWVIDALDECQKFSKFLTMIAKIPSYLRIFLTSRSTPEAQQWLTSLGSLVEPYQIQSEDLLGDLGTFIDSKMSCLPVSDGNGQLKLKENLLNKSSGSFLWVSLIIQELEQTYSEEDAEEILNEIPEDMNRLYTRMLESLPSNERAIKLTHCLFSWTLLTRRALTLSEMQCAIKLDLNQTVHNLVKTLPAICGQFMSVDQGNRIRSIHQTAHVFLLHQNIVPQLAVDEQKGHARIAQVCLKILNGNQLQGVHMQRPKSGLASPYLETQLLNYAYISFSDHVQKGLPEDQATWNLLCTFLNTKIPTWIEYLAGRAKLYHVTRTAKNLQLYLKRRLKSMSPLSADKDLLESWIKDLRKVSAKFRANLSLSPSSIHNLIPSLCPLDSMISKIYSPGQRGFLVMGLKEKSWDDCLTRIDYQDEQSCAVALGDRYLAVAISNGSVLLYYRDSIQIKHTLIFGERAKTLVLSNDCVYLAASSLRKAKIWDNDSGTQVWDFDLAHSALSMVFDAEYDFLVAATQGGYTLCWDLREGLETERWEWSKNIDPSSNLPAPNRSPGKVLLSPNANTLAACYRGLPIYLFDVKTKMCIGCCQRKTASARGSHYLVDALAFNPSMEIDVLVASYGDGELAVFDKVSTNLRHRIPNVFAQAMACSPDGCTLVTGSSRGSIRIFEFGGTEGDKLSLVYRIDAHEDAVRSIAFSSDSLYFADIRSSHCHIWEPAVLVQNDAEEGSQSELSQGSTVVPESSDIGEGPPEAGITAICCDDIGNYIFCGKLDGSVGFFETRNATQQGVLYRHALNVRVTSIAYNKHKSLLMTADESGRILINKISFSGLGEAASPVGDISTEEPIRKILPDLMGNGLIVSSRGFANLWTLQGETKGPQIRLSGEDGDRIISLHPTSTQNFIVLGSKNFYVYSWANGLEEQPVIYDTLGGLSLMVTPPTPLMPSAPENRELSSMTTLTIPLPPINYIAHLFPSLSGTHFLLVWPAESLSAPASSPIPQPLPDPDHLGSKIQQIITVWGTKLLFLDTNLWVCSLEMSSQELCAKAVKRHFFLLSEWQCGVIGEPFIIDFSGSKKEFFITFKERLLVAKRGLDVAEQWVLP